MVSSSDVPSSSLQPTEPTQLWFLSADAEQLSLADHTWLPLLQAHPEQHQARLLYCTLVKPLVDQVAAALLLLMLSPLLLLIALSVAGERRGPVLFRQRRIGHHGRPFVMYKFRTMISDRRQHQAPYQDQERRMSHKTRHDPRITRLGRFLRTTSLDELPQFFNIMRGEMSFIGPRPELPELVARYASWQHQRHLVRPGLSGWWQVHGRSERPMHENTELDLYYVEHLSLPLDLSILLRTVGVLFGRKGAF